MSIGNYLTALDEQREQLARNLVTMGVQASETEKLNTLVPKVLQIPQTKPDITLFKASIDALHDYGENELLSIIENTSLMGIPYPPAIKKAIEVLQKRASHIDDEIQEMIDEMEDDKK